jgi:isoleucyl-tRNA synthetase
MTDKPAGIDYRETVFLPKTDFAMKAGLPEREPALLKRWEDMGLYGKLREQSKGKPRYVLHDGPPYANGNLHIGHALNKILKDIVTRSRQMAGFDSNYVPGWDCHGLPIEWKIEEEYRAAGKNKDAVPINEFRAECRTFAEKWVGIQRDEFKRLGVTGDWQNPYLTMAFGAEAIIAKELLKFADSGQLYRGSKPVMWSVVEKTALAEAEVEYADIEVDTIFVKFPVVNFEKTLDQRAIEGLRNDRERHVPDFQHEESLSLEGASVIIWTTTPWTIPGNRAISYSEKVNYGLYVVSDAGSDDRWAEFGDRYIIADNLRDSVAQAARVESLPKLRDVSSEELANIICSHPLSGKGYHFHVPLLEGDHVTDDAGTGFVHTAPGHGADDYNIWTGSESRLQKMGIPVAIPSTVNADGYYTKDAPGFEGARVIDQYGKWGDANKRVMDALKEAGMLLSAKRKTISYPHSWRSKKPIIFRNTPQWFISMSSHGLRDKALKAIEDTKFFPPAGQNRLRGMIADRPDWVISRQRAWGVPIAVFVNKETGKILNDSKVNQRISDSFSKEGADAWFADGAASRFLGQDYNSQEWEQIRDILDVWFDSGCTHAFCLEQRPDLKWPADIYLEGSDQHRGWFHSSLLESCGTRGRAPYDAVLTHGFVVGEDGRKMSKSLGNIVTPQDVIKQSGADILRLWVASADYAEDLRLGKEILKTNVEAYRKLRNTMRYILGALEGLQDWEQVHHLDMTELERYILHRLHEIDTQVQAAYLVFDYKRIFALLSNFMTQDLSAFYFDIRKDALYCDPWSSLKRRSCRSVLNQLFHCLTTWWAPILTFTMEEVWLSRFAGEGSSVHLMQFAKTPEEWHQPEIARKWDMIRNVRRVVTGALELERAEKRIGSSLEAAPTVYVELDAADIATLRASDFAEVCITSDITISEGAGPKDAFRLDEVKNVAVVPGKAEGQKCARSWKISRDIGSDKDFPDITPRDAEAVREWQARFGKTLA